MNLPDGWTIAAMLAAAVLVWRVASRASSRPRAHVPMRYRGLLRPDGSPTPDEPSEPPEP